MPGRVGLKTTGELQKYLVALQGQQLWIDWGFLVVKHSLVDQFPEDGSFSASKNSRWEEPNSVEKIRAHRTTERSK